MKKLLFLLVCVIGSVIASAHQFTEGCDLYNPAHRVPLQCRDMLVAGDYPYIRIHLDQIPPEYKWGNNSYDTVFTVSENFTVMIPITGALVTVYNQRHNDPGCTHIGEEHTWYVLSNCIFSLPVKFKEIKMKLIYQ